MKDALIAAWARWEAEPLEASVKRILTRKAYQEGSRWEAIQRFATVKAQAAKLFRDLEAELSDEASAPVEVAHHSV